MKKIIFYIIFLILNPLFLKAQLDSNMRVPPKPSMTEVMKDWGPKDRTKVPAVWYGTRYNDFKMTAFKEEENIWLSNAPAAAVAKEKAEWARLRNAVYVCYPYARVAGSTLNDLNKQINAAKSNHERKELIKSKEKELKKQFTDPLTNLSVYQGKVLMKLINRETGNNCYDLIKEYKNGLNARAYQAVAFFFGSSLKQDFNVNDPFDRQIEIFVQEINNNWYHNPYRTQ